MASLAVLTAWTGAVGAVGAAQRDDVTYKSATQIDGCAVAQAIVTAEMHRVSCQVRTGPGDVEVHLHETDVFVILRGTATFVTGGTVVGPRTASGGLQIRGERIDGGESRQLSPGDVIVIPAGVPHWFKEVSGSVSLLSTKIIVP